MKFYLNVCVYKELWRTLKVQLHTERERSLASYFPHSPRKQIVPRDFFPGMYVGVDVDVWKC